MTHQMIHMITFKFLFTYSEMGASFYVDEILNRYDLMKSKEIPLGRLAPQTTQTHTMPLCRCIYSVFQSCSILPLITLTYDV